MAAQKNYRDHAFAGMGHAKNKTVNAVCQFGHFWNANERVESSFTELFRSGDYFLVCQWVFGCTPGAL